MTPLKYAIGLDMAKKKFDACLVQIDERQKTTIRSSKSDISNTADGFDELVRWVVRHCTTESPAVYCIEATGIYYEQLAWYLHQHGCRVSVVLPNKARHYLQSLGIKTKNDKIDAKGLAVMAAQQDLKLWTPLSTQIYELRQLTRFYQQLQESRTVFRNQLLAFEHARLQNAGVSKQLNEIIATLEAQIKQTVVLIEQKVKEDEILQRRIENIKTVKGLGTISIATIIAETDGFELFENISQLVSYSGYDVVQNQSGNRTGRTRISKRGNHRIRRILFMPAFSVIKLKVQPFLNLYQRVYERTLQKMKAYVAVQRKLLIIVYTLWKRNEIFREDAHPVVNSRAFTSAK